MKFIVNCLISFDKKKTLRVASQQVHLIILKMSIVKFIAEKLMQKNITIDLQNKKQQNVPIFYNTKKSRRWDYYGPMISRGFIV